MLLAVSLSNFKFTLADTLQSTWNDNGLNRSSNFERSSAMDWPWVFNISLATECVIWMTGNPTVEELCLYCSGLRLLSFAVSNRFMKRMPPAP